MFGGALRIRLGQFAVSNASFAGRIALVGRFCVVVDFVYVEQLLEPAWGAFLSRGFVDSHDSSFHALVLRARRA